MLSEFMSYLWIAISVAAGIVEILTLATVAVWFVPSGIFAFLLSLANISVYIQTACFIIISLTGIVLSRLILKNKKKLKKVQTHEALVGRAAIVTEEIDNEKNTGSVRINGAIWKARTEDGDLPYETYENGMVVTIVGIDGECLICSK